MLSRWQVLSTKIDPKSNVTAIVIRSSEVDANISMARCKVCSSTVGPKSYVVKFVEAHEAREAHQIRHAHEAHEAHEAREAHP